MLSFYGSYSRTEISKGIGATIGVRYPSSIGILVVVSPLGFYAEGLSKGFGVLNLGSSLLVRSPIVARLPSAVDIAESIASAIVGPLVSYSVVIIITYGPRVIIR